VISTTGIIAALLLWLAFAAFVIWSR